MRKTIGFFGDSFCAGREPESWCVLLANQLNAQITHWGEPGRSVWSTFFKFNQLNKANRYLTSAFYVIQNHIDCTIHL